MSDPALRRELPLYRLYVMRVGYVVLGLGQGVRTWSVLLHHAQPVDFWHGVAISFLGALTLFSLLGVRYPIQMLPLLIFEFLWKAVWVFAIWLPAWQGHTLDPDTAGSFVQIAPALVIIPIIVPLGYVWKRFVLAPSDRWR